MGAVENEIARRAAASLTDLQKWVTARFVSTSGVVYESRVTPSIDTIPALDRNGKLVSTFFYKGHGGLIDADKLDGQHGEYYLPAGTYTASDILTKLKTVDGADSGLDADGLDGYHAASFSQYDHGHADKLDASAYTAADVLTKLQTVDGHGSGLSADNVDGYESAELAKLTGATFTGPVAYNNAAMEYYYFTLKAATIGGWLRYYGFRKQADTTVLGAYGAYGTADALTYYYIGVAYNDWLLKITAAGETELKGALTIDGALTNNNVLFDIIHGTDIVLRNHKSGTSYLKLGIGQTTDSAQAIYMFAQADGGLSTYIARSSGANGGFELRNYGTTGLTINSRDSAPVYIKTADTTRMTVAEDGKVGIGVAPATQQLKVLGSVAVGGDQGGTASYTTLTNATVAVSTGTVTVKSRTTGNVNTTGFLKVYVGTAAKYVPYVD